MHLQGIHSSVRAILAHFLYWSFCKSSKNSTNQFGHESTFHQKRKKEIGQRKFQEFCGLIPPPHSQGQMRRHSVWYMGRIPWYRLKYKRVLLGSKVLLLKKGEFGFAWWGTWSCPDQLKSFEEKGGGKAQNQDEASTVQGYRWWCGRPTPIKLRTSCLKSGQALWNDVYKLETLEGGAILRT